MSVWSVLSTYNFYTAILKAYTYSHFRYIEFDFRIFSEFLISFSPLFLYSIFCTIFPLILAYLLQKRKKYKLCKVLSILVAIGIPWGTVLGIFSFILLRRESIKAEFYTKIATL